MPNKELVNAKQCDGGKLYPERIRSNGGYLKTKKPQELGEEPAHVFDRFSEDALTHLKNS